METKTLTHLELVNDAGGIKFYTVEHDDSWELDPIGYFVIRRTKKNRPLRVEHYTNYNEPTTVLSSKSIDGLRKAIIMLWPDIDPTHYGYICAELGRVQMAQENNLVYVQG